MSRKKTQNKKRGRRESSPRTNTARIITAVVGALFLLALVYALIPHESEQWNVTQEGRLSYPSHRGHVAVRVLDSESTGSYTLETISFQSKDYTVEGLLRIPSSGKKVPAVVILPGATVPKEGTQGLAEFLSDLGYASLGIEQRNRGGVDFTYDLERFREHREPIEHKMVYDALRAVDVLKQDRRIDEDRIALVGESNGGRFAIIAAALDPSVAGVIGISTSGYDTESQLNAVSDETLIRFYRSIDPDTYLAALPPRRFVLLHSINDSVIPISLAENTFEKAREPKRFYSVTTGTHGFSEGMKGPLEEELRMIFQ